MTGYHNSFITANFIGTEVAIVINDNPLVSDTNKNMNNIIYESRMNPIISYILMETCSKKYFSTTSYEIKSEQMNLILNLKLKRRPIPA